MTNMIGGTPPSPAPEKQSEPLLRHLSFSKGVFEGREILIATDKATGAQIAGLVKCCVTSGVDQRTVMSLEILLDQETGD